MGELVCAVVRPHNDSNWHQWVWLGGGEIRRDTLGRKNPQGWRWIEITCNNTECPAFAIVRVDSIEDAVERQFPVPEATIWGPTK